MPTMVSHTKISPRNLPASMRAQIKIPFSIVVHPQQQALTSQQHMMIKVLFKINAPGVNSINKI
jgi:hypothetical protein